MLAGLVGFASFGLTLLAAASQIGLGRRGRHRVAFDFGRTGVTTGASTRARSGSGPGSGASSGGSSGPSPSSRFGLRLVTRAHPVAFGLGGATGASALAAAGSRPLALDVALAALRALAV